MVIQRPGRARGFTMPEMMVVVAIIAILAAVATPSMRGIVEVQQSRSGSSDLFTSLMRARSEAVKRNVDITLAPVDAGNWAMGWRIPLPSDNTKNIDVHARIPSILITGPARVVFSPNGRIRGNSTAAFEFSTGANEKRCLQVDLTGRPYQTKTPC